MQKVTILDKLKSWKLKKGKKPLLLIGVRQVGKTHILKEFGKTCFNSVHYLNFEKSPNLESLFKKDLQPKRILKELSFFLEAEINPLKDLIIFDEIQACLLALTSLKYFQEEMPELSLCGAGSLLGVHLGPVSFPVGKVQVMKMSPMSFEEFLEADGSFDLVKLLNDFDLKGPFPEMAHQRLWEKLRHYFIVGGLPEAVRRYTEHSSKKFTCFEEVREIQDQLLFAYYADIAKHSGKANSMHIDRVFKSIPTQLEEAQDDSAGKYKIRGVVPGISHYTRLAGAIDWLEAAGLIFKVPLTNAAKQPLKNYTKESFFKLFLFDVGILGSMVNLSPKTKLEYSFLFLNRNKVLCLNFLLIVKVEVYIWFNH